MDLVSDAIALIRTGAPSSRRMRVDRPGGWRFAAYAGAGFHLVLAGGCWLLTGHAAPVALGSGDAVLLPTGSRHALAFGLTRPPDAEAARHFPTWPPPEPPSPAAGDGGTDVLCGKYRLDLSRTHPLLAAMPDVVHLPARTGRHPPLRAAIDLLGAELVDERPGSDAARRGLLDVLLVYLLRAWLDEQPASGVAGGWRQALSDPACAAVLHAVHSDPAAAWTLPRLAALSGVSRATLARRFRAHTSMTPMAYLTWWRMACAGRLLRSTDLPVAGVAARVGYGSAFAFSHAFTRHYGASPTRYRGARPS